MNVSVYDTYVTKIDGSIMHFDILVPDTLTEKAIILGFGQAFLRTKGQAGQPLTARECQFCHIEEASAEINESIARQGHHIIEMQGCHES